MGPGVRTAGVIVSVIVAATATPASGETTTGTATHRQRFALPPQAVVEVVREDVGRADAPATEMARTTIEGPGQPPIALAIAHDRSAIDQRPTYAVRARVPADGRLLFTSDTVQPVPSRGAPDEVTIMMNQVSGRVPAAEDPAPMTGAHGLRLPATLAGDVPCADGAGIRHHLNLWLDPVFVLGRTWLGKERGHDAMGRCSVDPERRALVLWGVGEQPLDFQILNNQRRRLLTRPGKPIGSDPACERTSLGTLQPLAVHLVMGGRVVSLADAARFTGCLTDTSFPPAAEGDDLRLEKAYLAARTDPGQPLMSR